MTGVASMLHAMSQDRRFPPITLVLAMLVLAGLHVVLAVTAARGKSPTFDEPLHALGAHLRWHFSDFRINPEDPPLWHYLAVIGTPSDGLTIDFSHPDLDGARSDSDRQGGFVHETLFVDNPTRVHRWISNMRVRMAFFGAALVLAVGLTTFAVAHSLGAPAPAWGSLASASLVALDPNVLAHAALMKNDVAITLAVVLVSVALWRVGQRLTPARVAVLALTLALAVNLKFSGVVLGPVLAGALAVRAMIAAGWPMPGRVLATRTSKLVAASLVTLVCALVSYASIWALYGFRHTPTSDPSALFEHQQHVISTVRTQRYALRQEGRHAEADALQPGLVDLALWRLGTTRLFPDAWTFGLHHVHSRSAARSSYFLGTYSAMGHWSYFPVAMAVKTPVTTLALLTLAVVVGSRRIVREQLADHAWTLIALLAPAGVLLALAMTSALNLGLRHVLPVYPVIWVMVGAVLACLGSQRARAGLFLALAGLGIEVGRQAPDFLSFFNALAGGSTGGARILSDSNLDWGQDLPAMARWQRDNPDRKLYLSYFGSVDPAIYGIRYTNLAPGYAFGSPPTFPEPGESAVLAVSATHLQGTYARDPALREAWLRIWRDATPMDVLGGTIYLYEFPLRLAPGDAVPSR
jgi:hypothetical protein